MQYFVAIDGRGGSGKTYLGNSLAVRLKAVVYHLDDFGNDHEPFVGIPALIDALHQVNSDVVIYEGVGVFSDHFNKFQSFKILVDTPPEIRKMRAQGRDVARSDRSAEEWARIYDIWRIAEKDYFAGDFADKADLVVGRDGDFDTEEIALRIESSFQKRF